MHDITEGGILGAVWEMCSIAGTGAEVWTDRIPVSEVTKKICLHFNLDYLRLISSGSMIIMVHPDVKDRMEAELQAAGVPVACIGKICGIDEGICISEDGKKIEIAPPTSDELYKVISADNTKTKNCH
jgi:hydrogenase expression/formation protein HypE